MPGVWPVAAGAANLAIGYEKRLRSRPSRSYKVFAPLHALQLVAVEVQPASYGLWNGWDQGRMMYTAAEHQATPNTSRERQFVTGDQEVGSLNLPSPTDENGYVPLRSLESSSVTLHEIKRPTSVRC